MPSGTAVPPSPDIPALDPPGRVALIGAGAFGRFCLDAYARTPDISVLRVADPDSAALAQITAPGVRGEHDWEAIVLDPEIEVVHLATPPFVRAPVALAALAAGKSIFCEKPIALTLADADSMIALARRSGVALGMDYVMRHLPAYHLLSSLAASGTFGRLRTVSLQNFAQSVPADHWFWNHASSGGILVEHGVHFFDAYGRIAGPPRSVTGNTPRPEAIEVTVEYRDGVLGRYFHEFAFPLQVERAVGIAFFERGYVEIDGWIPRRLHGVVLAPPQALRAIAGQLDLPLAVGGDTPAHFEMIFGDRSAAYREAIVAGMRDTVRRHRDPHHEMEVPARDARASLALALAAQRAADTGHPVILAE